MSSKNYLTPELIAKRIEFLKNFKKRKNLSWDEVGSFIEFPKRTILRWVKTGKMSFSSYRLTGRVLNKYHWIINMKENAENQQRKLSEFRDHEE